MESRHLLYFVFLAGGAIQPKTARRYPPQRKKRNVNTVFSLLVGGFRGDSPGSNNCRLGERMLAEIILLPATPSLFTLSANGRQTDFESVNGGSSPSRVGLMRERYGASGKVPGLQGNQRPGR